MLWTWSFNANGLERELKNFCKGPDKYFNRFGPHNNPMSGFGSAHQRCLEPETAVALKEAGAAVFTKRLAWRAHLCLGTFLGQGRIFLNPQKIVGDRILHLP